MAKTVKANPVEKLLVQKRLRAKYPQMYKKGWGKTKKNPKRTEQITSQLRKAGLSESDIAKLKGKRK